MHQTIKNILGGTIALGVLLVGYAAVSYVNSYGKSIQPSSFRSFSVTGDGKAIAIPDVAEFSFQVITQGGTDIASLQTQNTNATNKAIAFVKLDGVQDKDIQTQYYNVDPRYQTYNCNPVPVVYNLELAPGASGGSSGSSAGGSAIAPGVPPVPTNAPNVQPCPPSSIVGYTVTQSIDVKIRDFTKIGDILGGVVTNGANQVGALSFTIDDPTTVRNQARADAIAKARAEAQAIAQAGGFTVGRLLSVQEGSNIYPQYYSAGMGASDVKSVAASAPAIQPGSEETDVTMTLQYEIE